MNVRLPIKIRREQEVLAAAKRCRTLSWFWLTEPATRFEALKRLAKRGLLSYRPINYPYYRVVLHVSRQCVARFRTVTAAHDGRRHRRTVDGVVLADKQEDER